MSMTISLSRQTENRLLLLIIAIGVFLRFHLFAATEFNVDQMYPVWQALNTLQSGEFPLIGQGTSVLFANPALTGYIYAPFLIIGPNPMTPMLVTISLNSFGIWLAYRAVRGLLGVPIALVAATLFAINPWVIEYSRQTWVQSLLVFFITLIFWAIVPVLTQTTSRPERRTILAAIATTIFANTYLLSYLIVAPLGLLGVLFWPRLPKRALAIGMVIFGVGFGLYAYGLAREWEVTQSRADTFVNEGESQISDEALGHAIRLVTGWEYAAARGLNAPVDDAVLRSDISNVVHWLWFVGLLAGIGQAVFAIARNTSRRDAAIILLVWYILPILAMTYVSRIVHPFYLMFSVPAGHALAAWGISPLLMPKVGSRVLLAGLVFTVGINGLNSIRFYEESHANPGEHSPGVFSVGTSTDMGRFIRDAHEPGMVVYTPMDIWGPITFAGDVFPVVRTGITQRQIIIPANGGLYMTFHGPDEVPLEPPLMAQATEVPLSMRDGTRFALWRAEQNFTPRNPAEVPSDIGVTFIGWHLLQPLRAGQTSQLRTYWRVDGLPIERFGWIFVPYAHLFDESDQRIVIIDGDALPLTTWGLGDWMVQEMRISVPDDSAGPYGLNIGIVDGGRMVNAIFNDPQDDNLTYTADITLLE